MIRCVALREDREICGKAAVTIINSQPFCEKHAEAVKQNRPVPTGVYKKVKERRGNTIKN